MEQYLNNREVIKNLGLNTGTTASPKFTNLCTMTEATIGIEFEQQDWYVFCDAIQRSILTGVAMNIELTVKLDIQNEAIQDLLAKIHTMLAEGTIAQFNNQLVQFDLLKSVESGTLSYTKYQVPCVLNFSELGGPAEDASEFGLTIVINGKGTVVTA